MAKPPVMTDMSSERVMRSTNGLTSSGASVWPTKMLPAADRVSAPLVPIVRRITHAIPPTSRCMTPRW